MIKAFLVDDEQRNIDVLYNLIGRFCPELEIVGTAISAEEAIRLIPEKDPQIVFLDVEMPGKNAFDLIDFFNPAPFEIVFVTAFEKYALKAFRYSAIDYILKPISIDELKEAVSKVVSRILQKTSIQSPATKPASADPKKIAIPAESGMQFENATDIMYLQAKNGYTIIALSGKRKALTTKSLKDFEKTLSHSFFYRVHHSYIININFVNKYHEGRGGIIEMEDGAQIEVSVRKKRGFLVKLADRK